MTHPLYKTTIRGPLNTAPCAHGKSLLLLKIPSTCHLVNALRKTFASAASAKSSLQQARCMGAKMYLEILRVNIHVMRYIHILHNYSMYFFLTCLLLASIDLHILMRFCVFFRFNQSIMILSYGEKLLIIL